VKQWRFRRAGGAHTSVVRSRWAAAVLTLLCAAIVTQAAPARADTVLYRVDSGGAGVTASPPWEADTTSQPSPYVNAAATGNTTYSTISDIDMTDPSVPAGTPMAVFQNERWDEAGLAEMSWDFPVASGAYKVRLYFAEIWSGAQSPGARLMDVAIEGAQVLDNYDVYTDVGANKGVVKTFTVSSDGNLDIDFAHVVQNPAIKAIEILQVESPATLGALPQSVDFGSVAVGSSTSKTVQLTNQGGPGDPNIVVESTSISGPGAAQLSDDFDDSGSVTLSPGQATSVSVTFAPTSTGQKSGTLEVTHSGTNSPLSVPLSGNGGSAPVAFGKSSLQGETSTAPTSLQFGPDGRLYVAQFNGLIKVYTVQRNAANSYSVTAAETIESIQSIPNHDDNGALNPSVSTRLVTGLLVTGTAANPVIYVTSSDPRIGAGPDGGDLNLDTNSSTISRLKWNGTSWQKLDLVRGLPRSEENHAANGMALDEATNTLYVAQGGNTNMGAPSTNFAFLPEFALSAAVLSVDLDVIGETTYDLPTLDDEDRVGTSDAGDPFGGNDGKNQAKVVPLGPVQVHAPGFRNAYDLAITTSGRMYTIDNGGNAAWGDVPASEGPGGTCTNEPRDFGTTDPDSLHLISGAGYYGGHPNPTRGNTNNKFNITNPQSPVPLANAQECDYLAKTPANGALTTWPGSVNGIDEYTAGNFNGAMNGDLIAADYSFNSIRRVELSSDGTAVQSNSALFSTVGTQPLDVTTTGSQGPFPGTIWVADQGGHQIHVFEPSDFDQTGPSCTGVDDPSLDEDQDGYDNADEIDNGTSPCSAGDKPPDWDGDLTSNLNDPNDDNDGANDVSDAFAIDPSNGTTTDLPVSYTWENDAPNPGGLLKLGFTGLMTNGSANYETQFDPGKMTAGGAAGVVTIDEVPAGDAKGAANNQQYGFQFGVDPSSAAGKFTAHTRIQAPFAGMTPQGNQSMGLFVGNGDQDNYVRLATSANGGFGGIHLSKEVAGAFSDLPQTAVSMPGPAFVDLYLTVDPSAATVQASYSVTTGGSTSARTSLGGPQSIPSGWLTGSNGLAVGIISTSAGAVPFPATWDFIEVKPESGQTPPPGNWVTRAPTGVARQEVSYVEVAGKLYLTGGARVHQKYDPQTDSWTNVAALPETLDHIQGVATGGRIYYIGGLNQWPGLHSADVYIYDPATDSFSQGAPMPSERARGAGGVAVHNGKIYYVGGLHDGVAVPWLDVYDPVANSWTSLPDMPTARDHFHAAVIGGKLYAIGGRNVLIGATTAANEVYDISAGQWSTGLAPLPTPRGGFAAAALGDEVLIIGGEGAGSQAFNTVEAYNVLTDTWRTLAPMPTGRHGIQAAVCNGGVYIAAGGKVAGGSQPSDLHEVFFLGEPAPCNPPSSPPSGSSIADDGFARTVSGGLGTADKGGAWSVLAGSSGDFSVDGSKAVIAAPKNGQRMAHLGSTSARDVDARVEISFPTAVSGAGRHFGYLVLRRSAGGAHYRIGLFTSSAGRIGIRAESQNGKTVFADVDTGLTFTAGDSFNLRVQLEGAGPTAVRVKTWKTGTSEPAAWTKTATDARVGPQAAGSIGVRVTNTASAATTVKLDSLLVNALSSTQTPPGN